MADLSHVADLTRKVTKVLVIIGIAIVLLIVVFNIGSAIKNIFYPTPPPPPTVSFGKIPVLSFPQDNNNGSYSFTLNTLSGQLPTLPNQINIYKLQQPLPNLLGLNNAETIVAGEGFTNSPIAISDTEYQWNKTDPFPYMLNMNIQTLDFTMTSQYASDPTVTAAEQMPGQQDAETASADFFSKTVPLPGNIDNSKTKTTLFAITPSGLRSATSLSDAQIIRVDYFPKNVDNIPIITANPDQSLIYTLVGSGQAGNPEVIEAQYYHKEIGNSKATYPIISAKQAFDDLRSGKGYIASNPSGSTQVSITDVSLGYYVDISNQQYLWPIIVFQGDKGFFAYVSALTDEWVQK